MGMYAFHLPAVALVALWWSDSTALRGAEASPSFFVVEGDPVLRVQLRWVWSSWW